MISEDVSGRYNLAQLKSHVLNLVEVPRIKRTESKRRDRDTGGTKRPRHGESKGQATPLGSIVRVTTADRRAPSRAVADGLTATGAGESACQTV